MTSDRRFERDIPELLAQLAPRVEPTPYRDDVVRLTARTRQRPAWTFPERWIPMDITLAPGRGRPRPIAALVAIALVGLLIGALLVAYVGSRPVAVPPPFGPAENGALYFSTADGDIMTMASLTAAPKAIVTGNSNDSGPLPSRDGLVIAFTRVVPGGTQVMVADADGTNVRPLDGVYAEFSEIDWAPTSDELAIISMIEGQRKLTVVPTDGTAATTLDTGMLDNSAFWYLPDGRILFKGTKIEDLTSTYGLFVVDPHGTTPPTAVGATSASDGDIIDPFPSADGTKVVYHRWADGDKGLHVRDIATGQDRQVRIAGGPGEELYQTAEFSPDGKSILFGRFTECCLTLSVVPAEGGTPVDIGESQTDNAMPYAYYAPDGKSIIAWYPSSKHLWELDPTGKTPGRQLDLPVSDAPIYQRVSDR